VTSVLRTSFHSILSGGRFCFHLRRPPSSFSPVLWVTGVRRGSVPARLVFSFFVLFLFCSGPVYVLSVRFRYDLFPHIRNFFRSVSVCYVGFVLFLLDLFLFCSRSICFHRIRFVFRSLSVLFCFCFVVFSSVVRRLFPAMILFCIFYFCPLFCSFMGYTTVFWVLWILAAYVLVLCCWQFCQGGGCEAMW
jgi:hypothetical protein